MFSCLRQNVFLNPPGTFPHPVRGTYGVSAGGGWVVAGRGVRCHGGSCENGVPTLQCHVLSPRTPSARDRTCSHVPARVRTPYTVLRVSVRVVGGWRWCGGMRCHWGACENGVTTLQSRTPYAGLRKFAGRPRKLPKGSGKEEIKISPTGPFSVLFSSVLNSKATSDRKRQI